LKNPHFLFVYVNRSILHIFAGTMGKRLDTIKVENIEENRRQYRSLLMCCDASMGKFRVVLMYSM